MFNPGTIKTGFTGLLGFRNSRDPDLMNLESALTTSSSGVYFDDIHPLITIDNIDATAPMFSGMNYSAYSSSTTYGLSDKVTYSNRLWVSLTGANASHTPASGSTYWKLELNNWLSEQIGASTVKVINEVFTGKRITSYQKGIFENLHIFDGRARYSDTITKSSRRVGLEVRLKRAENIKAVVNQIGGMFSQAQTGLNIDIHYPGSYAPIATATLVTGVNTFAWKSANKDLDFSNYSNNIDSGGVFYISYLEDNLVGNAIRKRYNFNNIGACSSCDPYNTSAYNLWNKYFTIMPFEVKSSDVNGTDIWDIDKMGYTPDINYGLNLALTIKPDFTQLIIQEKTLFAHAIGLQFAIDILTMMRYNANDRSNSRVNIPRGDQIVYDLDNERGLKSDLDRQIKGLQNDFSNLGSALPSNQRSLKWGIL